MTYQQSNGYAARYHAYSDSSILSATRTSGSVYAGGQRAIFTRRAQRNRRAVLLALVLGILLTFAIAAANVFSAGDVALADSDAAQIATVETPEEAAD